MSPVPITGLAPATNQGALQGVKVLDLSRVLAGPWATQMLGDLGADVVKVERPGVGDDTRAWGPPWLEDVQGQSVEMSAYFTCANRNKRSVAIDQATPQGQELFRQLAAQADVQCRRSRRARWTWWPPQCGCRRRRRPTGRGHQRSERTRRT